METINDRVKKLRKYKELTLEKFAEPLGVKKNAISRIETAKSNVTDQMLLAICREYNVNEQWLRTGEGDMFVELPKEDEYFKAATLLSNDPLVVSALIEYQNLPDDEKAAISNYAVAVLNRLKEHEK